MNSDLLQRGDDSQILGAKRMNLVAFNNVNVEKTLFAENVRKM